MGAVWRKRSLAPLLPCRGEGDSGEYFVDDVAVDVSESVVAALEAECELFVVKAEQVQDGGLEIVGCDFVFDNSETQFIRLSVIAASADATTCHPHREAIWVVVASQHGAASSATFAEGRSAEFAAADDQRVFEESALFEILN